MSEIKGNIVRIKSGNDQYAIKDTISDYLTNEDLSSYLTKDDAESIYVKLANFASKVFELNSDTDNPYLTKTNAASIYLLKNDGIITTLQSAVSGQSDAIATLRGVATPELPNVDGSYLLKRTSNVFTWDETTAELPETTNLENGTYTLQCEKTANGTTLSWVSTSSPST